MTFEFKTWYRPAILCVLCIGAIVYISVTARDETLLAKSALRLPRNGTEAAYLHAVTSGFRLLGFKPEEPGTIIVQARSVYHARAAFLLKAYTFLRKVYTDPDCNVIQTVKLYPYANVEKTDGTRTLGPYAELVLPREGADKMDWSSELPDLLRFRHMVVQNGSLKFDPASVP